MACALGFPQLASRNPFVKDLEEQGFDIDFINGLLTICGLPYLDVAGALQHGDLVSKVDLGEDGFINPPTRNHQVWFRGSQPHYRAGQAIKMGFAPNPLPVESGFEASHAFSFKLKDENGALRDYVSFEEKIQTYLDMLMTPALDAYPDATPLRGLEKKAAKQNSPLHFPDTSSANYGFNDYSGMLRGKKVAIVGLGGTGAYILDLIARTHLEQIVLFDDDKVHMHTIFRMPGFIPRPFGKKKVAVLAKHYAQWRLGIEAVAERVTEQNIDRLSNLDFVFISVDDGPSRRLIVDWLSSRGIPFVDCGMGLNRVLGGLNGMVRITGVDRQAYERTINTAYLPTAEAKQDEYRKQGQIAELNALNAALAVVRFKQHFGLFAREDDSAWYTWETASPSVDSESTTR
jgi:hypothetical protein